MGYREAEEELDQTPIVGPPPPAAVAEPASANEAERYEEVGFELVLLPLLFLLRAPKLD